MNQERGSVTVPQWLGNQEVSPICQMATGRGGWYTGGLKPFPTASPVSDWGVGPAEGGKLAQEEVRDQRGLSV